MAKKESQTFNQHELWLLDELLSDYTEKAEKDGVHYPSYERLEAKVHFYLQSATKENAR